ncbi:MAG: carbamoyl phosphate synthase large subunit, partial [Gammaproteobacteria bacterium]
FVSKAIGRPLAKVAARCMVGKTLEEQGTLEEIKPQHFSVKESVFPFLKFKGADPILGPEMKSTGEVMGVGTTFAEAFLKSQKGASVQLPEERNKAFVSVRDADKPAAVEVAKQLIDKGFSVIATRGTARVLEENGIECETIFKVLEGRPDIVDVMKNGEVSLIINTTEGKQAIADSFSIRREALNRKIPYTTTIAGARATIMALDHLDNESVYCLQELH